MKSWANVGGETDQSVALIAEDGSKQTIQVPRGSFNDPESLVDYLTSTMNGGSRKKREAPTASEKLLIRLQQEEAQLEATYVALRDELKGHRDRLRNVVRDQVAGLRELNRLRAEHETFVAELEKRKNDKVEKPAEYQQLVFKTGEKDTQQAAEAARLQGINNDIQDITLTIGDLEPKVRAARIALQIAERKTAEQRILVNDENMFEYGMTNGEYCVLFVLTWSC